MRHTAIRGMAMVLVVAISTAAVTTGCPPVGGGHATPEAAFEAFKTGFEKKDWKAVLNAVTPESGDVMLAGMMLGPMMMVGMAEMMAPDDKAKAEAAAKKKEFEDLLNKHNVKLPASSDKPEPTKDPQAAIKEVTNLLKDCKDKGALAADLMAYMDKSAKPTEKRENKVEGKLVDVKIEGEKATGNVLTTKDGKEEKQPMNFVKVGGGWRIDMPTQANK